MFNACISDAQILERFAQIVGKSLRIDPTRVTPDACLDELGAESLDLLEISVDTEAEFNICLPEKNILQTAQDIFGHGILEKDGVLTEEGKRFFLRRMPQLAPAQLEGEISLLDLKRMFGKVAIWVLMIRGLMEYAPKECPQCGGKDLRPSIGSRLKCQGCGKECDIPSGELLNRRWVQEYYEKEYLPTRETVRQGTVQSA